MKSPTGVIVIGVCIGLFGISGLGRALPHELPMALRFISILLAVSLIICGVAIVRCRPWAPTMFAAVAIAALLRMMLIEWRSGEPVLGVLFILAMVGAIWLAVWAYLRSAIRDARNNASLPPPMESKT
jgi:hypothetical protein